MKKILAVIMALMLALALPVTSFAAETESGEISAAFADFDPGSIMDMFSGMDMSAITGMLEGMDVSAITSLFEGMDADMITQIFGGMDLSGLTDILGGLDIGSLLEGIMGNGGSGDETTTAPEEDPSEDADVPADDDTTVAPDDDADAPADDDTTKAPASTGNNNSNIPQTGDNGMLSAFAVCAIAAGAFIVLSKKKEA